MRIVLGGLLLVAGCATAPADGPAGGNAVQHRDTDQPCDASAALSLVGETATDQLAATALERTGATVLRWIRPGQGVTEDYISSRLNIEVDGSNRITRISCG